MSFGRESTTDEVLDGVDLSGQWVLITGASAGLDTEGVTDDPSGRDGVFAYALDPDAARALWARSEELVGESFPT
jgi:hypothetical protein